MKDKIIRLWKFMTTPEMILYLVFGVLSTVINILVFGALRDIFHWELLQANTMAWAIAVAFAFITNKFFVFRSKSFEAKLFWRELFSFLAARVFSLGVDSLGMWLLVENLTCNDWIAKIVMNVIVIIINYLLSKLFIFQSASTGEKSS